MRFLIYIKKIFKLIFQIYLCFLKYMPTEIGVRLRYFCYKPLFKKTSGFFRIGFGVTILGFENIQLGRNAQFMERSYIYANGGGILIGDNFAMNTNSQLGAANGEIIIGNNCLIGPNCVLRAADHNIQSCEIPIREQGHIGGKIVLQDDVWIASNCVILKDVILKTGTVVAAGAVVNKNFDGYSVLGGVPARVVKSRK